MVAGRDELDLDGHPVLEGGAKRWIACPKCGNEVANATYKRRDDSNRRDPRLIEVAECDRCAHRWDTGKTERADNLDPHGHN